jgi:hypothetical protein
VCVCVCVFVCVFVCVIYRPGQIVATQCQGAGFKDDGSCDCRSVVNLASRFHTTHALLYRNRLDLGKGLCHT